MNKTTGEFMGNCIVCNSLQITYIRHKRTSQPQQPKFQTENATQFQLKSESKAFHPQFNYLTTTLLS